MVRPPQFERSDPILVKESVKRLEPEDRRPASRLALALFQRRRESILAADQPPSAAHCPRRRRVLACACAEKSLDGRGKLSVEARQCLGAPESRSTPAWSGFPCAITIRHNQQRTDAAQVAAIVAMKLELLL